jgi:hypothetical protein
MISAIEWVPEGVADPNPKKYEFSAAELELIEMMENQHFGDGDEQEEDEQIAAALEPKKKKKDKPETTIEHNLPADLRMDEYSSDEDENDAVQGTAIGRLLVDNTGMPDDEDIMGKSPEDDSTGMPEDEDEDEDDDVQDNSQDNGKDKGDDEDDDDMDSDSDDDLNDVPDTREYAPLDIEGMNALGLSHVGTNAPAYMDFNGDGEEEDDASDMEDVQIQPGDALFVVAKTEEVSLLWLECNSFLLIIDYCSSACPLKGVCHFGSQCIRTEDRKPLCSPRYSTS